MSLTLLYKGKNTRFAYKLGRRRVFSGLVLLFGLFMLSSRSTQSPEEVHARLNYAQSGLGQQQLALETLKQDTRQQLAGMLGKLAEVQGEIHRINALGTRLVEQAGLNQDEFSFVQGAGDDAELNVSQITVTDANMLVQDIQHMLTTLEDKSQQLLALESILINHHIDDARELKGRPVNSGWLSSYYGMRKDPFNGKPAMHKGLDFAGKEGDPVVATGAGLVTWAGSRYGYGNLVEIDHGDGLVTRYGHNSTLNVKIGDVVTQGQVLAKMGSTGRSTGAHVHYEVLRHGKQLDPLPYVYRKK